MFCENCGKELKGDERFCIACGTPVRGGVESVAEESTGGLKSWPKTQGMAQSPAQGQPDAIGFANQAEQVPQRPRGKLSPPLIIAIVLALVVVIALVAGFIVSQSKQGETTTEQKAETSAAVELSPEESAVKDLDGWWVSQWHKPPYLPAFGHVHDGLIDWYRADTIGTTSVDYSSTVNITRAERFDENGAQGWRFFTNTSSNDSWAYYQAEGEPNMLPIYMVSDGYGVITNSNTDHPTRFGMERVTDDLDWGKTLGSRELFEQAKQVAAARDGSASSKASASAFDQAKAEAEARSAAEAAGKTVLTGTVFIGREADWAGKVGLARTPNPGSTFTYAGLILDEQATVSASNSDGATNRGQPYVERSGKYVLLGSNFHDNSVDLWRPYDGQRVTVAFSNFGSFSDSLGAIFSFRGTGERIAPLTEADVSSGSNASSGGAPDSDFVLPDSSTRRYTRSELEAFDNHSLFLARNEIFARHGCGFKTPELRERFGSMSWYHETIPAGTYGTEMLNAVEKDNAELMRAIEQERNSPYL